MTKEINKGETNRDLTVTVRNNVGRKQASQEYVVKFAGINNPPKFPECNTLDVEFDEENEGQVTVVEVIQRHSKQHNVVPSLNDNSGGLISMLAVLIL